MPQRRKPAVISARVDLTEKRLVEMYAARHGKPVSAVIWDLVIPTVRRWVASDLAEPIDPAA